jgi:hypothetical protein
MLISEQSITYHICTWERSKANNTLVLLLVLKLTKQAPPEGICAAALSAQTCSWGVCWISHSTLPSYRSLLNCQFPIKSFYLKYSHGKLHPTPPSQSPSPLGSVPPSHLSQLMLFASHSHCCVHTVWSPQVEAPPLPVLSSTECPGPTMVFRTCLPLWLCGLVGMTVVKQKVKKCRGQWQGDSLELFKFFGSQTCFVIIGGDFLKGQRCRRNRGPGPHLLCSQMWVKSQGQGQVHCRSQGGAWRKIIPSCKLQY